MSKLKGKTEDFSIGGFEGSVYLPFGAEDDLRFPSLYLLGSDKRESAELINKIVPFFNSQVTPFILISILPSSWEDNYSPFPAPPVKKDGKAFGGKAADYLLDMTHTLKPFIDKTYPVLSDPMHTGIAGYSLSGLCSLYSMYICPEFGRFAGISASFWFDGWTEFISAQAPVSPFRIYISLGKKEASSGGLRLENCGNAFIKTSEVFSSFGCEFASDWNNGTHFTDITGRIVKALSYIMKKV